MAESQNDVFETQVRHLCLNESLVDNEHSPNRDTSGKRMFCHIVFHDGEDGCRRMVYQWFLIGRQEVKMFAICFRLQESQWVKFSETETKSIKHPSLVGENYYTSSPCWSRDGSFIILDSGRTTEDSQQKTKLYLWHIKEQYFACSLILIPTTTEPGKKTDNIDDFYFVTGFRNHLSVRDERLNILVSGYKCFPPDDDMCIIDAFQVSEQDVTYVDGSRISGKGYTLLPIESKLVTLGNSFKCYFWDGNMESSVDVDISDVQIPNNYIHKDYHPIQIVSSPDETMVVVLQVHTKVVRLLLFRLNLTENSVKFIQELDKESRPARYPCIGYGGPYRYLVAFTDDSEVVAGCCQNMGKIRIYNIAGDETKEVSYDSFDESTLCKPVCGMWCQACVDSRFTLGRNNQMECQVSLENLEDALPSDVAHLSTRTPTVCSFRNGPLKNMTTLQLKF